MTMGEMNQFAQLAPPGERRGEIMITMATLMRNDPEVDLTGFENLAFMPREIDFDQLCLEDVEFLADLQHCKCLDCRENRCCIVPECPCRKQDEIYHAGPLLDCSLGIHLCVDHYRAATTGDSLSSFGVVQSTNLKGCRLRFIATRNEVTVDFTGYYVTGTWVDAKKKQRKLFLIETEKTTILYCSAEYFIKVHRYWFDICEEVFVPRKAFTVLDMSNNPYHVRYNPLCMNDIPVTKVALVTSYSCAIKGKNPKLQDEECSYLAFR
jgi:hypothetical protein